MPRKEERKQSHTSNAQRLAMITWLEVCVNFNLINGQAAYSKGAGGSTQMNSDADATGSSGRASRPVAGKKLKKTDAYKELAKHVNDTCPGSEWTSQIAKNRYNTYIKVKKISYFIISVSIVFVRNTER
jgi:hypothetical protein